MFGVRGGWIAGLVTVALACSLMSAPARAQSFELNAYRPAPLASDGFAVAGTDSPGHLGLNAALTLDYAKQLLVVELATRREYAAVSHQLAMHMVFALGLGSRGTVFAGAPVNLVMNGDDPPRGIVTRLPRADGAGIGDAYLGARVRLLGDAHSRTVLAAQGALSLPLASASPRQHYAGDDMVQFDPRLLLDVRLGQVTLRANLGARIRQQEQVLGSVVGSSLTYGIGVQYAFQKAPVRLLADLYGSSVFKDFFAAPASPLEVLFGAKYHHRSGFHAALAAGPGLTSGIGTPELRALLSAGFAREARPEPRAMPARREPPPPVPAPTFVAAPPAEPPADHDRDGILEPADSCPDQSEDNDGFEDGDGCPDDDNDKDGIPDANDACPLEAGQAAERGCAAKAVAEPVLARVEIGRVRFPKQGEFVLPADVAVLRRVKEQLAQNSALRHLGVQGGADMRAQDGAKSSLSKRRALTIARWLRQSGVGKDRVEIAVCGEAPAEQSAGGADERALTLSSAPAANDGCVSVSSR